MWTAEKHTVWTALWTHWVLAVCTALWREAIWKLPLPLVALAGIGEMTKSRPKRMKRRWRRRWVCSGGKCIKIPSQFSGCDASAQFTGLSTFHPHLFFLSEKCISRLWEMYLSDYMTNVFPSQLSGCEGSAQFSGFVRICNHLPKFHPHLFFLSYISRICHTHIFLWKCILIMTNIFLLFCDKCICLILKLCNHPSHSSPLPNKS